MKLEKTWMGICVWVIYLLGMIFAIGVTGFVSGLFPFYDRYFVAGGTVAACVIAAVLLGLILNLIVQKIVAAKGPDGFKKSLKLEFFVPVIILFVAIFVMRYTSTLVSDFTGDIALFDNAVVAENGQEIWLSSFAEKAYVAVLKLFMTFLGNSLDAAYIMHFILRLMLIGFLYISLRVALGMVPAAVGGMTLALIPSFGYTLKNVDNTQLTYTTFFMLLMLTVIYVYGFTRPSSNRWYYKICSVIYGAILGIMIYADAVSAVVIVFPLSAWLLSKFYGRKLNLCINELLLLVAGVTAFGGMLVSEGGAEGIPNAYYNWTLRFSGYKENAWLIMAKSSVYNTYFALILLALAFIPAVLFFAKRCTKITPFIIFSVLGIAASVFLGATAANSEVMIITFLVILICCGVSSMIHVKEVPEVASDEEEKKEEAGISAQVIIPEVEETVEDEEPEQEEESEVVEESEQVEEPEQEETPETEVYETDYVPEEQEEMIEEPIEEKEEKEEAPRFVPEGMVLPMGEENEEDLVPHFNMNRPEMQDIGILSVGGPKEEVPETELPVEKDDFDINIAPGDDFDI